MSKGRDPAAEPSGLDAHSVRIEMKYLEFVKDYSDALGRLARAYESDTEACRDLLQDIHVALWRSLQVFDGRCSERTWVYRVAHNVAASHLVKRNRRREKALVSLEELDDMQDGSAATEVDPTEVLDLDRARNRLMTLVRTLQPLDRQIILLYLEDADTASIGEVTGISPGNVSTKIHRIKQMLIRRFHEGGDNGRR
jgi:RNA polymerase sigma-70 factor (ECF subfamily)